MGIMDCPDALRTRQFCQPPGSGSVQMRKLSCIAMSLTLKQVQTTRPLANTGTSGLR
jgi:hypothetical protein